MAPAERRRVVYWFNQPTPYVVARFNALADAGQLDFEAWFSEVRQADRSWYVDESSWRFPATYLPVRRLFGMPLRVPIPELVATRPDVFVLEYDRLNLAMGAVVGRAFAGRVAFRVLPNFDAWSDRTWWRELSKHVLFRAVDGAKVPGPDGRALCAKGGLPIERTWVVRQSIDVDHFATARAIGLHERDMRRAELGLTGCVFVFVGRIWSGKGLDELLAAFAQMDHRGVDASILVIGDGVDEQHYRQVAERHPKVIFAGFVQPADLPRWYALADCLVFPTHGDPNGLVVEEAFAAGLPVIVSRAAGDIDQRVADAGMVVETGSTAALRDAMARTAQDEAVRRSMADATWALAEVKRVEDYAEDFERFVGAVLATAPRRSTAARLTGLLGRLLMVAARLQRWHAAPRVSAPRTAPGS